MKPVYKRIDGTYEIEHPNGGRYHATHDTAITSNMVEAYLVEHPEALVPEPAPPAPTPAELAAAERARALAALAALDARAIRPLRAIEAARKIASDEIAAAKAKDPPDLAEVAAAEARLDAVLKAEGAELARIETEAETIRKGI